MTFGAQRWGSSDEVSEQVFNAYVDAGGNSIDTADVYAGGRSEELIGAFIANRKLRDRLVLATKCGFNTEKGNPHGGGNGRKHIYQSLESSLRRLKTDYIDLYWMHVWDMVTPVEEVLQTLGDLVRTGRIRYFGFSDLPAWYAAKAATWATAYAMPGPIAMQLEYSLVERTIEQEHLPAARECGIGIMPWSPLAAGFLAGKYQRAKDGADGEGRLSGANPFGDSKFTDRNWDILEALRRVADEAGKPMAQVALSWLLQKPGVSSPIIGASRVDQLQDNLASLEVKLSTEQVQELDKATALPHTFPYAIFNPAIRKNIFGGNTVEGWKLF